MTDRELLELAAKAAGIEIDSWLNDIPRVIKMFRGHLPNYEEWNPLTDDGDAFRLQVKLEFCVSHWPRHDPPEVMVGYSNGPTQGANWIEALGDDPRAATRRAIVCAAAEIGMLTL